MGSEARVRPGRKRSEESRQAILRSALELIGEAGYASLTIEGIAARAGTGKQTIYRWWPSKADVVLDAVSMKADLVVPTRDEGSYRADLRTFLTATFELGRKREVVTLLRALMAQAQIDPAFAGRFRPFLERRRLALAVILDRAKERGDLPAHPPPATVADIVFGVLWYRVLGTDRRVDRELVDELVDLLAPTAGRRGRSASQRVEGDGQAGHGEKRAGE